MANLDFYAAEQDVVQIASFLFDNGFRPVESQSDVDRELREFACLEEMMAAYATEMTTPSAMLLLQLWHPRCKGSVAIERVILDPKVAGPDHFVDYAQGWGLIMLELCGLQERGLQMSNMRVQSEKRARAFSDTCAKIPPPDQWDWQAVQRMSRMLAYHIRDRLAVAKVGSARVLPHAAQLTAGGIQLQTWGGPGVPPMVPIQKCR